LRSIVHPSSINHPMDLNLWHECMPCQHG